MKKLLIILMLCSCSPKAIPTIETEKQKAIERSEARQKATVGIGFLIWIYICAQLLE